LQRRVGPRGVECQRGGTRSVDLGGLVHARRDLDDARCVDLEPDLYQVARASGVRYGIGDAGRAVVVDSLPDTRALFDAEIGVAAVRIADI